MISCGFLYFATGYKKRHGVIFQGTMTPCGLLASVHGSYSGRRNDAFMFRYTIAFCTFSSPTAYDLRLGKPESMRRCHLFKLQAASVCKLTAIQPTLCCRILLREAVTSCQNRGFVWSGVLAKFAHCGPALIMIGSCSFTAILQVFMCFYLLACARGGG